MRTQAPDLIMDYITNLYTTPDLGLSSVLQRLEQQNRLGVNIGIVESQMLKILIGLLQPLKIIECGTLFGYSTVQMAQALPANAHIFTIEKDLSSAEQARLSFAQCGVSDKVSLLVGSVEEKLRELESDGPFDMIFIDHHKAGYFSALQWAAQNIRCGGLIIGDNTLLFGGVVYENYEDLPAAFQQKSSRAQFESMRAFNLELSDPQKYTSILLPTSEGLSIALKKF
jgi:predicted O-methyltransferase YrrM